MRSNKEYTAMRVWDGTILISKYRHDYVTYHDDEGNFFMIDGGQEDYYRYSMKPGLARLVKVNRNLDVIY
jgi:hypothetical protein